MTRKQLESYRANKRIIKRNREKIEDENFRDIPVVAGKVKGSSNNFPYIPRRFGVQMDDPVEADKSRKRIARWQQEITKAEQEIKEVDQFIAGIADVRDREVLDLYYTEGEKRMSQAVIADSVGYTQGRISQIIKKYTKD